MNDEVQKLKKRIKGLEGKYQKFAGPYLKDPRAPREGETIGGGYVIFARTNYAKRLKTRRWMFEYGSEEDAKKGLARLKELHPDVTFETWARQ